MTLNQMIDRYINYCYCNNNILDVLLIIFLNQLLGMSKHDNMIKQLIVLSFFYIDLYSMINDDH